MLWIWIYFFPFGIFKFISVGIFGDGLIFISDGHRTLGLKVNCTKDCFNKVSLSNLEILTQHVNRDKRRVPLHERCKFYLGIPDFLWKQQTVYRTEEGIEYENLFNTKILFDHFFTDILKANSVLSIIPYPKDVLPCLAQHLILICSAKILMFSEWSWWFVTPLQRYCHIFNVFFFQTSITLKLFFKKKQKQIQSFVLPFFQDIYLFDAEF